MTFKLNRNTINEQGEIIEGRPGDLLIKNWDTNQEDLYIDVVVSNTLSDTNVKKCKQKNINKKKEKMKKNKYNNQENIMSFAIETHGAIGDEARKILQHISARIAFRKNKAYSMVMNQL